LKTVQFALKALRHPYRIAVFTIVFSFGLGLGACQLLSEEARYLLSARNQATEQNVRRNLGEPLRSMSNKNRETLWVYEFREFVQGGNNAWTMTTFFGIGHERLGNAFDVHTGLLGIDWFIRF